MEKVSKINIIELIFALCSMFFFAHLAYQTSPIAGLRGFVVGLNLVFAIFLSVKIYKDYRGQPFIK